MANPTYILPYKLGDRVFVVKINLVSDTYELPGYVTPGYSQGVD